MKERKKSKINGLSNFEIDEAYENENWIRTNIRTFAFGENRNQSDISATSLSEFSSAKRTIGAIPIVARYNNETDNLEGHNVILRKNKDDEYEMFHDTDALGFTSPTATYYLEEVNEGTEINPSYKTYIVVEDVYLWKRFDATKKILEWRDEGINTKVSMEIDNVVGSFNEDGYFAISDFTFSAITALGSDVEPCFPQAEIQLYTVNDFKSDLKQLMYELTNQETVKSEGGKELTENINEQVEQEVKEEFEADAESGEVSIEEQVETTQEFKTITEVTETTEVKTEVKTIEVEEDTEDGMRDEEMYNSEATKENKFEEESTDTTEVVEETTITEEISEEVAEDTKVEYSELASQLETANNAFAELTQEYESLKVELEELRQFKRDSELNGLYSKFEGKLTKSELDNVFANNTDKTVSEIENLIFVEIGKKNFSLAQTEKQVKQPEIQFSKNSNESSGGLYGDLIAKHLNN